MPGAHFYDADYFENGIATGKSGYTNYTWLPELTIPLAYRMLKIIGVHENDVLLDFGSSKGYLVYAFRLLGIKAYGVDISGYAIESSPQSVKAYNKLYDGKVLQFDQVFDWMVSKDTFEHILYEEIDSTLHMLTKHIRRGFIIVPLSEDGKYIVPQYENDASHVVREGPQWWINTFEKNGFEVEQWSYDMTGLKDSWKHYRKGNAFFKIRNRYLV